MDIWLFGSPTSSEALRALKQAGVSRVVARGEALAAAQAEGLTSYTVLHAFPTTDDQEDLAQDVWGRPIEWFGSACPNSAGSRSKFFNSLAAIKSQVAGVFLDGVRFPSFGSSPSPSAFFSCFCPRCQRDMQAKGYDPRVIQGDVQRLAEILLKGPVDQASCLLKAMVSPSGWFGLTTRFPGLQQWLCYKVDCIDEFTEKAAQQLAATSTQLCGFLFQPALAYFVGQDYYRLSHHLAIISPMIYRNYPTVPGPATINQELETMAEFLAKGRELDRARCLEDLISSTGLPFTREGNLLAMAPEGVVNETLAAKALVADSCRVIPIIWAGDPLLATTLEKLALAGIDDCILFSYQAGVDVHSNQLAQIIAERK